jgi:hypothetical protein
VNLENKMKILFLKRQTLLKDFLGIMCVCLLVALFCIGYFNNNVVSELIASIVVPDPHWIRKMGFSAIYRTYPVSAKL